METPLSSRRRGPRWCLETRKLDVGSNNSSATSTPSSNHRGCSILPTTPSAGLLRRPLDFEDDDDIMPSTQNFNADSEVFWNYEASPETRAKFHKCLAESDLDDEDKKSQPTKIKSSTPAFKLKYVCTAKQPSINNILADKNFLLMKELCDKIDAEKESRLSQADTSPKKSEIDESPKPSLSDTSDPFAKDDSFLVMCSQAIDEKLSKPSTSNKKDSPLDSNSNHTSSHTFKMPKFEPKKKTHSPPRESSSVTESNVFDEDDAEEFEMLLSQIDIPAEPVTDFAKIKPSKSVGLAKDQPIPVQNHSRPVGLVQNQSRPVGPVQSQPKPELLNSNRVNSNLFKRFKSADDARGTVSTSVAKSGVPSSYPPTRETSSKSFRRVNSVPETPPGPLPGGRQTPQMVTPKCSKAEIERKRQEAIKRRIVNSQRPQELKR